VFVADLDGHNEMNLTNNAAFDGWPLWMPDGKHVVFASNRTGPAYVAQIFVIGVDGKELRQVSSGPWGYAQPSCSMDGRSIFAYQFQETADFEFGNVVILDISDWTTK
jgi:Tol biopolymer transport system component